MGESREERRKRLEAELAALDTEEDEPEYEYEIGRGDNYARVSSKSKAGRKLHTFFQEAFGINLDDEPVQDEDASGDDGKGNKPSKPVPVHFRGNRAG